MGKAKVTVGIVSNNRLWYLRALIESFVSCHGTEDLEFVLVDNASREPGFEDYISSLSYFAHRVVERCSFAEALNKIVELSTADFVLLLSDDIQFIVRDYRWVDACVRLLTRYPRIGSVTLDAQRRSTIREQFGGWRRRLYQRKYYDSGTGIALLSYGNQKPGIVGAGINSLTRKTVWLSLGPWRSATRPISAVDATLGAETEMLQRYQASGMKLERCILRVPAAADLITDRGGFAAKVRDGRRYGRYFAPRDGRFYYAIHPPDVLPELESIEPLPAFEDIVKSIGFELPLDQDGNLIKGNPTPETEWSSL